MSFLFSKVEEKALPDGASKAIPPTDQYVGCETDPNCLVKTRTGFVAFGNKPKGRTSSIAAVRISGKGKGKSLALGNKSMPRDGLLYNSTGRPQMWVVPNNNAVFRVVQSYETPGFAVSSAALTTYTASIFTVNFLDQITSLTAVFDQYKIEMVEVWLTPRCGVVIDNATANMGTFHTVIDYDDNNVLTTIGQALDYANVVVSSGCVGHYRRFVPHIAVAAYSGTFTSFANETAPWIDAASPTVAHYGMKTAWTTTDIVYTYDLQVRIHTAWRNVR